MDIFGKKPQTKTGEYFRNNVWWWHPLWDYCEHVAPEITGKVVHAHYNSADGLDGFDARQLGFKLQKSIDDGTAEKYVEEFYFNLSMIPDEPCFCEGKIECLVCSGTGLRPSFKKSYHINMENIKEFTEFLMVCGGFEIC